VPWLLPWLDERRPDVVCLQETVADDAFLDLLGDELRDRGYTVAVHGEATWNGVAILSHVRRRTAAAHPIETNAVETSTEGGHHAHPRNHREHHRRRLNRDA
jgi:exonuclease III